jgi:hypothetical protein
MLPWIFLLCILILLWLCILLWTNPFLLFYFPECLRGWLDYPGHSILFSRPLVASLELTGGLFRHYSCGHPIGISLQVRPWRHLTPDWHFSSSLTVASLDTRLAFLFKSDRGVTWHPTSISLQDLFMTSLEFTGGPATTLVDTRFAFLFKTYRGVTLDIRPAFLLFYFP